jgi:hypothetical protein
MLDVHAPEHPIHGVRDFFTHLFTITVGLLIALGLENAVEWRHHVHLQHQAEDTMRRELQANQKDLHITLEAIPTELKTLHDLQTLLQSAMKGSKPTAGKLTVGITQATLDDAAWNSASATGALTYIPFDQVKKFSSAYQLQKKFEGMQDSSIPPIVAIAAAMGTEGDDVFSKENAAATLKQVQLTMASLTAVASLGQALDHTYDEALKPE